MRVPSHSRAIQRPVKWLIRLDRDSADPSQRRFLHSKRCWLLAILALLSACAPELFEGKTVNNQSEALMTTVSVSMVEGWEDYIDVLSPKFTLDGDTALTKVLPRAMTIEEKFLMSTRLKFEIKGGPPTPDLTAGTNSGTGGTAGALSSDDSTDSSEDSDTTDTPKDATSLPGLPDELKSLRNDPFLEYLTATGLYQEVQLLNRYVRDAALRRNMVAYIVRLQVGITPYARDMPYDVYTTIGFYNPPDEKKKISNHNYQHCVEHGRSGSPAEPEYPQVLPLLVTDNLEGAMKSRAVQSILQLAGAVTVPAKAATATVEGAHSRDKFAAATGTDLNSLLTVGRMTDNTIVARLGANLQATGHFAMVPRNHFITLVVLADKEQTKLHIVARTQLRHVKEGEVLSRSRVPMYEAMRKAVEAYRLRGQTPKSGPEETDLLSGEIYKSDLKMIPECKPSFTDDNTLTALRGAVIANNYGCFDEIVEEQCKGHKDQNADTLWMAIAEAMQLGPNIGVRLDLPVRRKPALPTYQAVLLLDNPKAGTTTAFLRGGRGLQAQGLTAILTLHVKDKNSNGTISVPVPAQKIEVSGPGGGIELTFPSLKNWSLVPATGTVSELHLAYEDPSRWEDDPTILSSSQKPYKFVEYLEAPTPKPSFELRRVATVIRASANGIGTVHLFLAFEEASGVKAVRIKLDGADLTRPYGEEIVLAKDLGQVLAKKPGRISLDLANLDPGTKVTITAEALDSQNEETAKPAGVEHPALEFQVKGTDKSN